MTKKAQYTKEQSLFINKNVSPGDMNYFSSWIFFVSPHPFIHAISQPSISILTKGLLTKEWYTMDNFYSSSQKKELFLNLGFLHWIGHLEIVICQVVNNIFNRYRDNMLLPFKKTKKNPKIQSLPPHPSTSLHCCGCHDEAKTCQFGGAMIKDKLEESDSVLYENTDKPVHHFR